MPGAEDVESTSDSAFGNHSRYIIDSVPKSQSMRPIKSYSNNSIWTSYASIIAVDNREKILRFMHPLRGGNYKPREREESQQLKMIVDRANNILKCSLKSTIFGS